MPARRLAALSALALALAAAGCGEADPGPVDAACTASPGAIERALAHAPAPVALPSGTRLSECVAGARTDADLENAGLVLTRAADHLADRARRGDAAAALDLGYLVGAARRGAARTNGIHAELAHRVESSARVLADSGRANLAAALQRGLRAGQTTG
jgi:hypothetical protein